MNEKMSQLIQRLRTMVVARVDKVVTDDKRNLISFTDKDGFTLWDDEPNFESAQKRFTPEEWMTAERSYSHYFGFSVVESGNNQGKKVYFQLSDHSETHTMGFGHVPPIKLEPPRVGGYIVGSRIRMTDRGLRFGSWTKVSAFEMQIRQALLDGVKLSEDALREMERNGAPYGHRLAHFGRLVVNGDIYDYLEMKWVMRGAVRFDDIDTTVYEHLNELRPELWQQYCDKSLEKGMYSTVIPKPAPKTIADDLSGMGESVGLNTPFASLELVKE